MSKERIKQAYEQLAPAYNALIDHKPHNAYYDRPNTLALLGDVKGKKILHLMYRNGLDSISLALKGANITAIDMSENH